MGVFAGDHGFRGLFNGLAAQFVGRRIAEVVEGGVARMTVVEGRARSVELAHLVVHRLNVRAYPTLVAQAPEDDAGVVEVTLHQRLGTVDMGLLPCRILAHLMIGIAIAVALLVGLVHDVDAPAVAELVEVFAVGIVRGAQEVDVGLLHQPEVQLVGGIVHPAACRRVMVVTVHAAQLHVPAVDLEDLADHLYLLDAQMVVEMLNHRSVGIAQLQGEGIEVGRLCRPELRPVDDTGHLDGGGIAGSQLLQSAAHLAAVQAQHGLQIPRRPASGIAEADRGLDLCPGIVLVGHCRHVIVGNMHQRAHPQLHLAEDA